MQLSRKPTIACAVLTVAALTSACGSSGGGTTSASSAPTSSSAAGSDAGTITIGAVEMLTGDGALYGQAVQAGLQVAVDTINAKGGMEIPGKCGGMDYEE